MNDVLMRAERRAERRRVVNLIRDWLKSESGISDKEIQRKLQAVGTHLCFNTTHNYCEKARILMNREVLFGPDAERMFPKRNIRR